jgi:(1->4)-alpha-D-glucan 1-alpha-D-glucosylmutase
VTAPRATYRLQLNKDFTFSQARDLLPYLDDLGISHLYLSPILMAQPGSTHGYDTVDHTRINPELGTLADFRDLAAAARQRDMGILLDFVPNHMGVGGADNSLWLDVLRHGEASAYADWFDIDWHPPRPGMDGRLLVPVLGESYAATLAAGHLQLRADEDGLAVWAYDTHKLPIAPQEADRLRGQYGDDGAIVAALNGDKDETGSWAALESLISRQHWRLAHHSVASDEINYRRFFINSELAGIRIDRPEVFEHAHRLIFQLVEEGLIDGLRLDHVDGLLDPKGYLEMLRQRMPRRVWLLVEKILAPHERLRSDWPIDGTSGYEVGEQLTRVLMQPAGEAAVTEAYADFVGDVVDAEAESYNCRLRVMDNELTAELLALSRRFAALAWTFAEFADLTQAGMQRALREVIAQMPVYRTYADDAGLPARDRRELGRAIALARRARRFTPPAYFDFIAATLCRTLPTNADPKLVAAAIGRFQQYTGPVMAKGLEDTALYRYNRLVALNEVGAHPNIFSRSVGAFHNANLHRLRHWPQSLIATSTHDTKRGEDTRAIIAAIADAPDEWTGALAAWLPLLQRHGAEAIHRNDLYLLLQMLLGGWPLVGNADDIPQRLCDAMVKSLREARERSDWAVNDTGYEETICQFVRAALADESFVASFLRRSEKLREIGRRKGLIQAALKLTIPGVPDIYRGAEDWEQSYVDPDNRRQLDFAAFAPRLAAPATGSDDKLVLTRQLLALRRRLPLLFAEGSYEPLDLPPTLLGFRRRHGENQVVTLVDLSPGHWGGIAGWDPSRLATQAGSAAGPYWVLAQ